MSGVIAALDTLTAAATDVAGLGAAINAANAAAAVSTTRLMAAAGDEVSADIAALFSDHALQYQAVSAEAVAFHGRFVQALTGGVQMYAAAETANTASLQTLGQDLLGTDQVRARPASSALSATAAQAETVASAEMPLVSTHPVPAAPAATAATGPLVAREEPVAEVATPAWVPVAPAVTAVTAVWATGA